MNLKKYFLYSAIMGLVSLTSCSDDDSICEPLKLTFSVSNLGNTSTSVDSKGVGLWISSTSLNSLKDADVSKNQKFIPNGQDLTAEGINWTGQEKLYTYGYYPYDANAANNPEAYAVNATNHSNLMWAKTETSFNGQNKSPKLAFAHLMSKLVLNVKSDAKEAGALIGGEVTLNNLQTQATANLLNGQIEANGTAENVTPTSITASSGYEGTYETIVVPQTLEAGTEFLTMVTTGNVTIKAELAETLALNAGQEVTLEVVLKEEEATIKVQEIKTWENLESESAIAEKLLPSFNVLDLYDVDGVKGIVISLDEGSEGKHGWIVSLDEAELEFEIESGDLKLTTGDFNNGANNMKSFLEKDPTLAQYPAAKWCNDKNVNGIEGWVLPAHNTLKLFGELVFATEVSFEAFNSAIENEEGTPLSINHTWNDIQWYSSTSTTRNVKTITFNPTDEYYYGWAEAYDTAKTLYRTNKGKVRAFYHF